MSLLDQFLERTTQIADTYGRVKLAENGVNAYSPPPTMLYETNGAGDPVVAQGSPAAVSATGKGAEALFSSLERMSADASTKAAAVAGAHELRKMLPYIAGMTALGITIYLLTKK